MLLSFVEIERAGGLKRENLGNRVSVGVMHSTYNL